VENLRSKVLIEALPYIKTFWGKTLVIKYGGSAMVEEGLKDGFARDVVLLKYVGMRPVIVHGGGPQITSLMERMGKKAEFVNGHRVTDSETMEIVEMVLCGKVNKEIVNMINRHGAKAVGLSGVDGGLIQVTKHKEEIGLVGDVKQIDPGIIDSLDQEGFVPVIASLGVGEDDRRYNVNADLVAGEMASSLKAIKLVILTDIKGILDKRENLISTIRVEEIEGLIEEGVVSGGMIPKLRACEIALRGGVKKAHIIDGRIHHSLLLELFTDEGIGTQVIP
jgi:acetylglutamate kinase